MNSREFNEKYKDYLVEGHYSLAIEIPEITEYLDEVFKELIKIPGFKYHQIKSKFDMGRFYTNLHQILGPRLSGIIEWNISDTLTQMMKDYYDRE